MIHQNNHFYYEIGKSSLGEIIFKQINTQFKIEFDSKYISLHFGLKKKKNIDNYVQLRYYHNKYFEVVITMGQSTFFLFKKLANLNTTNSKENRIEIELHTQNINTMPSTHYSQEEIKAYDQAQKQQYRTEFSQIFRILINFILSIQRKDNTILNISTIRETYSHTIKNIDLNRTPQFIKYTNAFEQFRIKNENIDDKHALILLERINKCVEIVYYSLINEYHNLKFISSKRSQNKLNIDEMKKIFIRILTSNNSSKKSLCDDL